MPLTALQCAQLRPRLGLLRAQSQGVAARDRARLIRATLEDAGASPTWEEWEAFVAAELGSTPPALARPHDLP